MEQKKDKTFMIGQIVGTFIVTGIYLYLLVKEKPIPGMIDGLFGLAIATLLIGEKAIERITGRRGPRPPQQPPQNIGQ